MNTLKIIVTVLLITLCFSSVTALAQDDALIHHYKFDGNLKDSVGDSDGVYVEGNGILNFIEGFDATPNGAINFDDSGEEGYMVYLGDFSPVQEGVDGEITVTFWILWYGATDKRVQDIINKRTNYEEDGMMWGINIPNGQTFSVRRRGYFADSSLNPDENEWTHITITMDGVNADFYKNGEPNDTQPYQFGTKYDANIHIGTAGNANGSWREVDAFNGALDDLRFYSRKLTDEEIVLLVEGYSRTPPDGATEVARDRVLSWWLSESASAYDVYLGTDVNNVSDANRTNPLDVLVAQGLQTGTYTHDDLFEYGQTYYWRIDEVNDADPNSPLKGDVWSFTTRNYILIEDFEAYNDINEGEEGSNRIYLTWSDGYANPNVNGSTIGYPDPDFANGESFVETDIVHGGNQSGPFLYNNTIASSSEVTLPMSATAVGSDWTQDGPTVLTLWFYGETTNPATESLYVKLNSSKVTYSGDAADILAGDWIQWDINLSDFAGVNLASVTEFTVGTERTGAAGGEGKFFLDDIRLRFVEQ